MAADQSSHYSHKYSTRRRRSASDPFTDPNHPQHPPPPPPKPTKHFSPMSATGIVEVSTESANGSARNRVGRAQTSTTTPTRQTTGRRSQSQESVLQAAAAVEKAKAAGGKSRSKKPTQSSRHADVIDRLDFTGASAVVVHHDGPFDACAPSRNRHRTKAPMLAWSNNPLDEVALARNADSPYPATSDTYQGAFSPSYPELPRKKVDAIAEAWGIHEPEPFEEFCAGGGKNGDTPASSIYAGKEGHYSRNEGGTRRGKEVQKETQNDVTVSPRGQSKRTLPPPQPIFSSEPATFLEDDRPLPSPPAGPKRTKSLMHRIRKMRETPTVPVNADPSENPAFPAEPDNEPQEPADRNERPTHKSHPSFLGRFSASTGRPKGQDSSFDNPEQFVYVDKVNKARSRAVEIAQQQDYPEPPTSPGLGRRTSLLQKVGLVRRA